MKEGMKRWGGLGRKKRFSAKDKCHERFGDDFNTVFYAPTTQASFVGLIPRLSFSKEGGIEVAKGFFAGAGIPAPDFAHFSYHSLNNAFFYSLNVPQGASDCSFYWTAEGNSTHLDYSKYMTERQILDDFKQKIDRRVADWLKLNQKRLPCLQNIDENKQYAYARLVPEKPRDDQTGFIESEIGRANLNMSQLKERTSERSENFIVASYSKNETTYMLLTPDVCLPLLSNGVQGGICGIISIRESFLKNIFSDKASASFLQNSYCSFGSLDVPEISLWLIGGVCFVVASGGSVAGYYFCTANKKKKGRNEAYDREMFPLKQNNATSLH
ncbi:MAG: hypothetical protein ACRCYZ_04300 [Alphaproteobacteria bacterium]